MRKKVSSVGPAKQKPKSTTSSLKTNNITNSSGSNVSEHKPNYHHETKEKRPSRSNEKYNVESDFPALGGSFEQGITASTVWMKPFGVSFSEKLKANTTSSYFYNEPPQLPRDRPKEEKNTTMKSKVYEDINGQTKMVQKDKLSKKSTENISKQDNVTSEEKVEIVTSQFDNEGFSIVQNKPRKLHVSVESNDDKSSGRSEIL